MEKTKLSHRMWAKILAYFMIVLSLTGLALSVVGAVLMVETSLYTMRKEEFTSGLLSQVASSSFDDIYYWLCGDSFAPQVAQNETANINAEFEILDITYGREFPVWKSEDYDGVYAAAGEEHKVSVAFFVVKDDLNHGYDYYYPCGTNTDFTSEQLKELRDEGADSIILMNVAVDPALPFMDEYWLMYTGVDIVYSLRYAVFAIAPASLVLLIVCFIFILCGAGHREGREGIISGYFTKIPFDLLTAMLFFTALGAIYLGDAVFWSGDIWGVLYIAAACVAGAVLFTLWCASFALRVKLGFWWKNTVVFLLLRLCLKILRVLWKCLRAALRAIGRGLAAMGRGIGSIPLVWKTALALLLYCLLDFIGAIIIGNGDGMLLWFLLKPILIFAVLYTALMLRRLKSGGEALARGDMSHRTDTRGLVWDFKAHAENLNSISLGMTRAVDERMKSERFKTELITNVSHDIKTPLTSIINYSDLICREETENEKIKEYSLVLHRQSERLKKLIEDLMDASKASTGSLEVHPSLCQAGVLLTQAAGEYEKRLSDCSLQLIVKQPEKPLCIMADGRHISRVFDNLLNNICKYSQPGTRVYLSLEEAGGKAVFSFKNTSRYALDISSEELMERFVRGDKSRSTEGSGLGLSIAKSLTELQGGSLEISVDGDLFKAVLKFDTV